ncbi:MAG: Gfo/Idh/MocA family oxidoreductase [Candidatus Sumerlaeota bacterium]|nr:Gfo/Idh/MocA family oxidoreductase [Candidatus Sumerlaeota bacterium]
MAQTKGMKRREFFKTAAKAGVGVAGAALAFPTIIPSSALGADGAVAPSNRITVGMVGVGLQGSGNLKGFLGMSDAQVVALCDVDKKHLASAMKAVADKYGAECKGYGDFREVTRRPDVDAVCITTPDHWHTIPGLDAVRHGKDVFIEKPLTLTINEGKLLREEVRRYGRILQTGSMQRSMATFRRGCELVRNGRIGKIHTVYAWVAGNNHKCGPTWQPEPVPPELDYETWLGPAPYAPYTSQRCHYTFRFILDYSGGQTTNWGAHSLDISQWGLGMDDSGPVEITGNGEFATTGLFTTATKIYFECVYANGVKLICKTGSPSGGVRFEGDKGWVDTSRGYLKAEPASLLRETIGPNETHLYMSNDHKRNFFNCIRTRQKAICDEEVGHRSATMCHLGNISMMLKRTLKWDPAKECFVNDDEANRMMGRFTREPWTLI